MLFMKPLVTEGRVDDVERLVNHVRRQVAPQPGFDGLPKPGMLSLIDIFFAHVDTASRFKLKPAQGSHEEMIPDPLAKATSFQV